MRTRAFFFAGVTLLGLMGLSLVLLTLFSPPIASLPAVEQPNLLENGDFEGGFVPDPACGLVGRGWQCFTVGDHTRFVAQPEEWARAVRSGRRSQLLGVLTIDPGAPPDRYFGLYQTVRVVPHARYTLVLHGIIRADDRDPDPWRYQVEWGYDPTASGDWRSVAEWRKVPWYRYDPRVEPGPYMEYRASFEPPSNRITLFVRLKVKWGTWPREVILNLDDLALIGPTPHLVRATPEGPAPPPPPAPNAPSTPEPSPTVRSASAPATSSPAPPKVIPATGPCRGPNLLTNGDFEAGFLDSGVAKGWHGFSKGGIASFGFWDERSGTGGEGDAHGQVMAINTMGLPRNRDELTIGITQTVRGLEPGSVYQVCFRGRVQASSRAIQAKEGPVVEWGLAAGRAVEWHPIPWTLATPMTDVMTYTARFTATAPVHTLALQLRAKPAERPLDVAVVLREIHLIPLGGCTYIVRPGDTLSHIAVQYRTTVADLVRRNRLSSPNLILVGQRIQVPCQGGGEP